MDGKQEVFKRHQGETLSITVSREHMLDNVMQAARSVVRAKNKQSGTIKGTVAELEVQLRELDAFDNDEGWTPVSDA